MTACRRPPTLTLLAVLLLAARAAGADAEPLNKGLALPAVLLKSAPEGIEDLKAIQAHIKRVVDRVSPCVVGIRAGGGEGSGVIVSPSGKVLTAGHVSGEPGREVTVILPTGRKLKAKALGSNGEIDSGMVEITEPGPFPYVEMGRSTDMHKGQWVLTLGHPGGFKETRTPVVRLGRVLDLKKELIRTDCTLVGGDSGGPLFDMQGRVVGIHSRIGPTITENVHVPVDTYRETWDRLAKGESWGGGFFGGRRSGAFLGVESDPDADECRIGKVLPKSPAEKAGLKPGDVVTRVDESRVELFQDLVDLLSKHRPGQEVTVEVRRGDGTITLKVKLERAPRS